MAFFARNISTSSYVGQEILHQLTGEEGNKKLMVLFPGLGYYVSAPLLHYMRKVGWSLGYDVLSIVYGFQGAQKPFSGSDLPTIWQESKEAIGQALESGYDEVVLVGKSLGTPMVASLSAEIDLVKKVILLTPIQNCHQMIQNIPTLAVIGTADPAWEEGLAVDSEWVQWSVFDDLDHSMEYPDDVSGSIRALDEVMQACTHFLQA